MEVEKYETHLFYNGCRTFFEELSNQFKIQFLKTSLPKKRTIQRKYFLKKKLKQKVINLFSSKHKRPNNNA
jgi:hypothetical protein